MSTSSNGDNNNMLDKGLSSNICESMKARFIPSSGSSPPSLSSSPPSTDPENNLNKSGTEKGGYCDKPVLNIDHQNYTLKTPPSSYPSNRSNASPDQVLVNITSSEDQQHHFTHSCATELRLAALTCTCTAVSPVSSSALPNSFINNTSITTTTTTSSSSSTTSGVKNTCSSVTVHKLSSLFPLLECRSCFHAECGPYCNNHPCKRLPPDSTQLATLPKDVVSTTLHVSNYIAPESSCNLKLWWTLHQIPFCMYCLISIILNIILTILNWLQRKYI